MTNVDDTGPAATTVTPELKELRAACDRLDIKWHHRNNEATLKARIDKAVETDEVPPPPPPPLGNPKPRPKRKPRNSQRRSIPSEIKEALEYMNSYHQARAGKVREYIESLL